MKKINVMIVDDSILTKVYIRRLLGEDPKQRFHVIERASNGKQAIYSIKAHMGEIDVITMDIEMPVMNGLDAVREIMKETPLPIIMLSSISKPNAVETIRAMEYGAYDFPTKPETKEEFENLREELYQKIENGYHHFNRENKTYGKVPDIINLGREREHLALPERTYQFEEAKDSSLSSLIVIGTSTGGPRALNNLINMMPEDIPAGTVIVQHMSKGPFIRSMAERLNGQAKVRVKVAEQNEVIENGTVYFSDTSVHLEVRERGGKYYIHYQDRLPVSGFKPSVDVLFESVAKLKAKMPVYGIVATGMGYDGAMGLKRLKESGAVTIIESVQTAVIYGMPKKAKDTGAVDYEMNINEIMPFLCERFEKRT